MAKRVAITGAGVEGDPYRPDLPEGVAYTVVEDHGDGTVTVETPHDPTEVEERLDALVTALENANSIAEIRAAAGRAKKPK